MPENSISSKMNLLPRLEAVVARVRAAEKTFQRPLGSVQVLPVSKTRDAAQLKHLLELLPAEISPALAENYLQEALGKIDAVSMLGLQWHFIGPIQSNKTALISSHFQWAHSVARLKIARRLSAQRPTQLAALNVCLQVNVSAESSKSGVTLAELPDLAAQVAALPNLRLRGLMAIPAVTKLPLEQRAAFHAVAEAFTLLKSRHCQSGNVMPGWQNWDTLSMGMSADLEMAIAEGATIVRIGTDIFGPRAPS
jgi:PLP dependent protein